MTDDHDRMTIKVRDYANRYRDERERTCHVCKTVVPLLLLTSGDNTACCNLVKFFCSLECFDQYKENEGL